MLGGLWEFPGGKRKESESLEDTCAREIIEETGIQVEGLTEFAHVRHAYSHFTIDLHAFLCEPTQAYTINEGKSGEMARWVLQNDLQDYAFPRANRKIIDLLVSGDHE